MREFDMKDFTTLYLCFPFNSLQFLDKFRKFRDFDWNIIDTVNAENIVNIEVIVNISPYWDVLTDRKFLFRDKLFFMYAACI